MNIAITADLHLTTVADHPERYNALENILAQSAERGIADLVIAGDLFDQGQQNYADFEDLCGQPQFKSINIHVIRGNHDVGLHQSQFASGNIYVYSEPVIESFGGGGLPFVLLPYEENKTMGEALEAVRGEIPDGRWVDFSRRLVDRRLAAKPIRKGRLYAADSS